MHRLVVAIHVHRLAVDAVRHGANLLRHGVARGFDDPAPGRLQVVKAELAEHGEERLGAVAVAGRERVQVALRHQRIADVGGENPHQRQIWLAAVVELHDRNPQALLEELASVRAEAAPADVGDVAGGGEQRHWAFVGEHRRHHGEVVQMARAVPRIVGDQHVARRQLAQRIGGEELADARRHRVDVARRSRDGLRQHRAVGREDACREVARFAHDGREGGAHERLRLLLDDGEEAAPDQLISQFAHGAFSKPAASAGSVSARRTTMLPTASTHAVKPAGTTVTV